MRKYKNCVTHSDDEPTESYHLNRQLPSAQLSFTLSVHYLVVCPPTLLLWFTLMLYFLQQLKKKKTSVNHQAQQQTNSSQRPAGEHAAGFSQISLRRSKPELKNLKL